MSARVLIVDDHPVFRQGLVWLIGQKTDFVLCGEAADYQSALQLFTSEQPDLAVVDLSLHESSGLQLIKNLRSRSKTLKILVASMHDEAVYAERCIRAGANGYINKGENALDIVQAMQEVLAGKTYLNEKSASDLNQGQWPRKEPGDAVPAEVLSDREMEVFALIGNGFSTKKIADRLCLSPKTIDTHRENIKRKLGVRENTELVQRAVTWMIKAEVM